MLCVPLPCVPRVEGEITKQHTPRLAAAAIFYDENEIDDAQDVFLCVSLTDCNRRISLFGSRRLKRTRREEFRIPNGANAGKSEMFIRKLVRF